MKRIAAIKHHDIVEAVEAATNRLPNKEKLRISVSFLDEKGRHWQNIKQLELTPQSY